VSDVGGLREPPAGLPPAQGRLSVFAVAAIFVIAVTPVLMMPILPMIDYYSHVARYFALSQVDTDTFLARNYRAEWAILPNIGLDVVGTGLMRFLPPLVAAKTIVVLMLATQYFGLLYFNRQLTGRTSLATAFLAAPLLYSFIFTWGFANFLLGLGLVFWGAGLWLALRNRLLVATPVACLMAILIFLTHGLAFALYGLLLGALELGFFVFSTQRSFTNLARRMAALAVQAVIPALLFMASPTSKVAQGFTNADEAMHSLHRKGQLIDRLETLLSYRLGTILRVSEGPSLAFDLASGVIVLLAIAALAMRGRVQVARPALPALLIAGLLIAIVPPTLFGVGYVSDRMPLFAAFLLLGALSIRTQPVLADRLCIAVVGIVVATRIVAVDINWQAYRSDFADFQAVRTHLPPNSLVGYVNLANGGRMQPGRRCEMFGPLMVPIGRNATPIFAFSSQQPIALIGRLAEANRQMAKAPKEKGLKRDALRFQAMLQTGAFDYALVCASEKLDPAIRAQATLVAQKGRLALFRFSPP
jgi:hypothetical protein